MKKILLIAMVCCIVTATAVFASTQTNLVSSKSCTKRYPWTLYNKTIKKCVCPTGMKRKRKTRCDIVTSTQWTWSIKTWGIVSTSSLLSTGSKQVFASWFNATWSTVSWTIATGGAMLNWIWTNPNNRNMFIDTTITPSATTGKTTATTTNDTVKACIKQCWCNFYNNPWWCVDIEWQLRNTSCVLQCQIK